MPKAIEVYRGDGLRRGRDVVVPLLSDTVLVDRGRAEMDAHAHQKTEVLADIVYKDNIRLGNLMEMLDISTSTTFKAKVTGIRLKIRLGEADMELTMERPV